MALLLANLPTNFVVSLCLYAQNAPSGQLAARPKIVQYIMSSMALEANQARTCAGSFGKQIHLKLTNQAVRSSSE